MEKEPSLIEKIPDKNLMQFANSDSDAFASVIIELDLPEPKVEFEKVKRRGLETVAPVRVAPETTKERAGMERKVGEARDFLNGILESPAKWLSAAHIFIADATPSQLRRIAEFPLTRAIHPNRTYR